MSATSELTKHLLQKHIKSLFEYLTPLLPMVNFPMVKFFVKNAWQTNIPKDIQTEIQTQSDIKAATEIFWQHLNMDYTDFPENFKHFHTFLSMAKKHHLDSCNNIWTTPEELMMKLNDNNHSYAPPIKGFMSVKKNHEVEITADVIASMCNRNSARNPEKLCIIDAGDGKGYLSTRLSLEHNLKVLGVDCNPVNTKGAIARSEKLERFWVGMKNKSEEIASGKEIVGKKMNRWKNQRERRAQNESNGPKSTPTINENYKNATYFITPQTNFTKLFNDHFETQGSPGLCLTGLHTCGDLAPSCLRIYTENEQITAVCNIGCCYHLLTEQFHNFIYEKIPREKSPNSKRRQICKSLENLSIIVKEVYGFPMSKYLTGQKIELGRNARMAACQSLYRTIDRQERPNDHLFYRALLEVLLERKFPQYLDRTEVGRMKQCQSFVEYCRKAAKRNPWLQLDTITDDELNELYDEFKDERERIDLYHLMRITVATVVEGAIMLDRLLYLKENEKNVGVSYLVRFFDPVISPRYFGVVALKNFQQ